MNDTRQFVLSTIRETDPLWWASWGRAGKARWIMKQQGPTFRLLLITVQNLNTWYVCQQMESCVKCICFCLGKFPLSQVLQDVFNYFFVLLLFAFLAQSAFHFCESCTAKHNWLIGEIIRNVLGGTNKNILYNFLSGWACNSVVEQLCTMCEALGSFTNPNIHFFPRNLTCLNVSIQNVKCLSSLITAENIDAIYFLSKSLTYCFLESGSGFVFVFVLCFGEWIELKALSMQPAVYHWAKPPDFVFVFQLRFIPTGMSKTKSKSSWHLNNRVWH